MSGAHLDAAVEPFYHQVVPHRPAPRIRIAYCVTLMDLGGTELNAARTAERLDHDRFDVTVVSLADKGPLLQRYASAGIPVERFPITSLYNRTALREGLRLYRFLRANRIEILHCHDMYSNIFAAPWARLARVPMVIASRRWWHSLRVAERRGSRGTRHCRRARSSSRGRTMCWRRPQDRSPGS